MLLNPSFLYNSQQINWNTYWILTTGIWKDQGVWEDDAVWIDN